MSAYVISDLHLSINADKSMEVFGPRWLNYTDRLAKNWNAVVEENDTVIVPGDISWGLTLEDAIPDLLFLEKLNGKKIIGKGNHDFWWQTLSKIKKTFDLHQIKSIEVLYNNAFVVENFIACGTRGWYNDEDARNAPDNADFLKLTNRESLRLRASLTEAARLKKEHPDKEIVVFMHFPPYWNGKASDSLIEILKELERLCHSPNVLKRAFWQNKCENEYTFVLHSANPVGVQNMRAIIEKNGWKEVF